MTTANILSNSTASIDFNKEIAGLMSNTASANGRELKLAVALHVNRVDFEVPNLVSAKPHGFKSKSLSTTAALLRTSEAFKLQHDKAKVQAGIAKRKDDIGFKASAEYQRIKSVLTAACSMFDRAAFTAYALRLLDATIVGKSDDKWLNVKVGKAQSIGGKDYSVGETFKMTRKDGYELGRSMAKAHGLIDAKSPAKAGAGVATQTGNTAATVAGELSKAIGALTADASDEFIGSAATPALFGALVRKLFAHDGSIVVADLVTALRSNEALKGVAIVTEVKPTRTRKAA